MNNGSTRMMIEARGLSKFFGPFVAIRGLSFSIPQGQVVAFLGPNGAGKTTTMKILTGYLAPSEGDAIIAGKDIRRERIEASRKLGYLPENGPLYPDMTPHELLEFFAEARGLDPDSRVRRIQAVTGLCALQQVLRRPISKLSRGYRQRVGLAQALLHDPDVLIMDEPTAGLDPNQIREFRENIQKLGRTKTILISTHILQEVDAVADRVLFIHEGRLIFDGTPDELKENGSLEEPFYRLTRGRASSMTFPGDSASGPGAARTAGTPPEATTGAASPVPAGANPPAPAAAPSRPPGGGDRPGKVE